jgi:hypothetical protein
MRQSGNTCCFISRVILTAWAVASSSSNYYILGQNCLMSLRKVFLLPVSWTFLWKLQNSVSYTLLLYTTASMLCQLNASFLELSHQHLCYTLHWCQWFPDSSSCTSVATLKCDFPCYGHFCMNRNNIPWIKLFQTCQQHFCSHFSGRRETDTISDTTESTSCTCTVYCHLPYYFMLGYTAQLLTVIHDIKILCFM